MRLLFLLLSLWGLSFAQDNPIRVFVNELAMEWLHETFGRRNVVERWFFYIKHRIKRFYKRFPWNAKYETVYRWLASFIVIYTIMNLKS
jgi:transposase-like protein